MLISHTFDTIQILSLLIIFLFLSSLQSFIKVLWSHATCLINMSLKFHACFMHSFCPCDIYDHLPVTCQTNSPFILLVWVRELCFGLPSSQASPLLSLSLHAAYLSNHLICFTDKTIYIFSQLYAYIA